MREDIFQKLSIFGLSDYEIRVYKSLLLNGPQNSTEIVKNSGVPQPRVYDLFNNLMRKGLIEVSVAGKKKIYRAVPVKKAFSRLINEMNQYLEEIEDYVNKNRSVIDMTDRYVWLIEGESRIIDKMEEMLEEASVELVISLRSKFLQIIYPTLNRIIEKGITIAIVVYEDVTNDLINLLDKRIVIKKRSNYASEVLIADRSRGLINVDTGTSNYALYFEEDEIIHILNYYYYHTIWWPSDYINSFTAMKSRTISTAWLACEAWNSYHSEGQTVHVDLNVLMGNHMRRLRGIITDVKVSPGLQHTLFVKSGKRTISVGGKTARIEDARLIRGTMNV